MPKQFPPEIKERALGLYLKGDKSAREISEVLWDDFATEVKRLCPDIGVPVKIPVHKARTLSGLKGSIPTGVSFRT